MGLKVGREPGAWGRSRGGLGRTGAAWRRLGREFAHGQERDSPGGRARARARSPALAGFESRPPPPPPQRARVQAALTAATGQQGPAPRLLPGNATLSSFLQTYCYLSDCNESTAGRGVAARGGGGGRMGTAPRGNMVAALQGAGSPGCNLMSTWQRSRTKARSLSGVVRQVI